MTPPFISLPVVSSSQFPMFNRHVCPPTFSGGPLDAVKPTREIELRLLVNIDVPLPDGEKVPMWIIEDLKDQAGGKAFPSKTIRTIEGDIVHAKVHNSANTHTVHWHGIEPTPANDGVGKHSFEVSGSFVYQFATNGAGTFLFHCHKSTPLHFELGLYGFLIVDPAKPDIPEAAGVEGPPYRTGGPGFVAAFNPSTNVRKYDVEAFLAFDEIDTRWHKLNHNAFMQACDPDDPVAAKNFTHDGILNDFRPDVFSISGALRRQSDPTPFNERAVNAKVGQTILLRLVNAGYTRQEYRIGLPVDVVAMDGAPLGVGAFGRYSQPFSRTANEPFTFTSAMRHDLLIQATEPGKFPLECRMLHWVTGRELFTARTFINVS